MENETGIVIGVNEDTVTVKMKRSSACSRCGACAVANEQEMYIEAQNLANAKLNDRVKVSIDTKVFFQALGILYCIPLITLLLGIFTGAFVADLAGLYRYSPLVGFATGIIFAIITYQIIKLGEPKRQKATTKAIATEIVA
ncbi:MAG: SoxR reducing system RseC family protein [Firmicutes bacterium]|nr:SoxR reducing system RseC family protein [Bacillota bacterium]